MGSVERNFPTGAEMCLWKDNHESLRESMNYLAFVDCQSIKRNPVGETCAWHEGGYAKTHGINMEKCFENHCDYLDAF